MSKLLPDKNKLTKEELPKIFLWSFLLAFVIAIVLCPNCWTDMRRLGYQLVFGFFISLFLWVGNGMITDWFDARYSWVNDYVKRFWLNFLAVFSYSSFIIVVFNIYIYLNLRGATWEVIFSKGFYFDSLVSLMICAIICLFLFGLQFLGGWRESALVAEKLKSEQLTSQFEALKTQLNPHFLFNSLNALSTLIYKDQDTASLFTDQLSKVYRYVLENQSEEIVPLSNEMAFTDAYVFLQQIRFGDNLKVNVDVSDTNFVIPPLALQMLIENAIKHNVISKEHPLTISIRSDGDFIAIKNNLQKKKVENSTGIGLDNIKKRFQYLSNKEIKINETSANYEVKLPLLNIDDR